jgi:hypothetical protein
MDESPFIAWHIFIADIAPHQSISAPLCLKNKGWAFFSPRHS